MPTTKTIKKVTKKSSRLGTRDYKVPPPLRFTSVKDAKKHIRANKMKVKGHEQHTRGPRIHVVDKEGKARTICIEPRKEKPSAE